MARSATRRLRGLFLRGRVGVLAGCRLPWEVLADLGLEVGQPEIEDELTCADALDSGSVLDQPGDHLRRAALDSDDRVWRPGQDDVDRVPRGDPYYARIQGPPLLVILTSELVSIRTKTLAMCCAVQISQPKWRVLG
jgi:hypothetical protein